jgi:tetratricopeptide (TPR) repeat protein
VQTLRHWLADPAARLITLVGPGGVGKTRLALELARAIAEEGATPVVFVPLAAIRDPAFVASAIAEALGLADVTAVDLPRRARVACGACPMVAVLDNFEHVLDAAPLVADLMISVPSLRLLVTSRAPLRVRGEREYAVGPFALEVDAEAMSPADLARVPAVRLFVERVRDVQAGFRLTSVNGSTVTAICRRLDSLPLALDDLENYRAALTWLIARGRAAEASDIAWNLMFFWLIRGQAEGLRWYEQILNLPSVPSVAESRVLHGAALLWYTQGEVGRARAALTRALALAHAAGDMDTVVRAEDLSGRVEHALGNLNAARDWFTRIVEGCQAPATPWGVGNALIGMARVVLATGDADHAERLLDEATSKLRHAGPYFMSRVLYVRAILAARRGNADEAIRFVRESLTRIRDLQDKYAFAYTLVPLAAAAVLKSDDAWAARILGARDAVSERTGATVVLKLVHDLQEQAEVEGVTDSARIGGPWRMRRGVGPLSIHS